MGMVVMSVLSRFYVRVLCEKIENIVEDEGDFMSKLEKITPKISLSR